MTKWFRKCSICEKNVYYLTEKKLQDSFIRTKEAKCHSCRFINRKPVRKKPLRLKKSVCGNCGKSIIRNPSLIRSISFCDKKCYHEYYSKIEKKCSKCGKIFYVSKWEKDRKFCGKKCTDNAKKKFYTKICKNCGKKFITKGKNRKCCSIKCSANLGNIAAKKKTKFTGTRPEKEFEKLLIKNKIDFTKQKMVEWKHGWKKFYDFYIPSKNLLIEIDGVYWHGKNKKYEELNMQQKQTRDNDIIKNQLAVNKGYQLIRIWEDEIVKFNIEKI